VRPRAFEGHRNVGVEPIVHQPQLRRLVGHEHRGERGAEAAAARIEFYHAAHFPFGPCGSTVSEMQVTQVFTGPAGSGSGQPAAPARRKVTSSFSPP
jgi:hypothetical protein